MNSFGTMYWRQYFIIYKFHLFGVDGIIKKNINVGKLCYVLDKKTPILNGYFFFYPLSNNMDVNSLFSLKKISSYKFGIL